jgi:hypothetical protein
VGDAVKQAYVYSLNHGLRIAAGVSLLGALLAWTLISNVIPARAHALPAEPAPESAAGAPAGEPVPEVARV